MKQNMPISFIKFFLLFLIYMDIGCAGVWNSPHLASKSSEAVLFNPFSISPKHLDPVVSYSANEWEIISQIYEPPLQYNYLKRPYTLEPLTLKEMPDIRYYDRSGREVDSDSRNIAFSEYTLNIREDMRYQNHPAFVKTSEGELFYGALDEQSLLEVTSPADFSKQATRQLGAEDYAYAIKRMAVRQYHSPILDSMAEYIVGLKSFSEKITEIAKETKKTGEKLDLRQYSIEGVKVIDPYTLSIKLKGKYPQFLYWLSMNFFAPIPWEVDLFYQQKGLIQKNLTLNWYPVGTGPYMLVENNPNRQIRLMQNPNYHDDFFPALTPEEAEQSTLPKELLQEQGKKLPFIKEVVYSLEKESIPFWNKFLQGYYDASGVSSEAFDQAVKVSSSGDMGLSQSMKDRGISLASAIEPSVYYTAFNMVDPVVGGYSQSAKKLRQAISIAQHEEEYISIFLNERGIAAQGPIPPGIFGYEEGEEGTNKVIFEWKNGKQIRKPIEVAKKLLAEAGYPNGISKKTGKQLTLYYDTTATGPDDRALLDWRRKQFAKLGIQLVIRASDYNRFQDKVRRGKAQIFSWGWNADYPDPENFLFLLYGGNASVKTNGAGINSSNYQNPKFDRLFEKMKTMENTPERLEIIRQMLKILQEDAPWVWGIHPKSLGLYHAWYHNVYPHAMAMNTLKYKRIDAQLRYQKQQEWNQPIFYPILLVLAGVVLIGYLLYRAYQNRQRAVIKGDQ